MGVAPGGVASALDALLSSVAGAACAEEPQASGLLKVRASAPGAEVYLDGALIGTVPLTAVVPATLGDAAGVYGAALIGEA